MQELAPNSRHSSLSGTAVKQSREGSRNLVCTLATIRAEQANTCPRRRVGRGVARRRRAGSAEEARSASFTTLTV